MINELKSQPLCVLNVRNTCGFDATTAYRTRLSKCFITIVVYAYYADGVCLAEVFAPHDRCHLCM